MPVTIGTLTSNVSVADSGAISEEMLEMIIQRVLARLRTERYLEEQAQREREIRDRMSEPEPF